MKHYNEPGTCEIHHCALKCVPQVYHAPYYICPQCEVLAAYEKRSPGQRLDELQNRHAALLHEYGEVKAKLKRLMEAK